MCCRFFSIIQIFYSIWFSFDTLEIDPIVRICHKTPRIQIQLPPNWISEIYQISHKKIYLHNLQNGKSLNLAMCKNWGLNWFFLPNPISAVCLNSNNKIHSKKYIFHTLALKIVK
jgi:hypothetical protein